MDLRFGVYNLQLQLQIPEKTTFVRCEIQGSESLWFYPKNHGISSAWWFGYPRTLRKTESNPSFLQGPVILREVTFWDSIQPQPTSDAPIPESCRFSYCASRSFGRIGSWRFSVRGKAPFNRHVFLKTHVLKRHVIWFCFLFFDNKYHVLLKKISRPQPTLTQRVCIQRNPDKMSLIQFS